VRIWTRTRLSEENEWVTRTKTQREEYEEEKRGGEKIRGKRRGWGMRMEIAYSCCTIQEDIHMIFIARIILYTALHRTNDRLIVLIEGW
jgi:hypothetical protein